ncbi:hypothetical protein PIB30_090547 [Stylosanthes scabra]|uniref:Uncharacterized protein n=1 Tax=Stylosanthes scabra TaxID=79078 RepID=A0ABU6YX35_9FABA|nr:hypothetical protein [Stylosanthes scabra]
MWPFSRNGASGFSSSSTAEQVTDGIDATGLTAIVTGANSGIGAETARVLALRGVHVIMGVRNINAAQDVKESILKEIPSGKINVMELDLGSMESVRKFALQFNSSGKNKIENWDSLPALPASIFGHLMFPIQNVSDFHDSNNAFLMGGGGESWELHCHNGKLQISKHDSIRLPPISPSDLYFVNYIRGKIYLFAYMHSEGFWVLESGKWIPLPAPPLTPISPTLRDYYTIDCSWCHRFVANDKLFILAYHLPRKEEIVVYDPQSNVWEKVEDGDTYSRLRAIDFDSITTISVPDVSNNDCSVALAFKKEINGEELVKFKLYALLLDKQTNLVRCRQSLDECSNEIQVSKVCNRSTNMRFVDLGNGMVCALIFGRARTKPYTDLDPILSILVFTLAWTQEDQRFLSVVDVSVNQVYTWHLYDPNDKIDWLRSAFIVTPKKGRKRDFSTAILEQKNSLNWPGDKTKKDSSSTVRNLDAMEV